MPDAAVCVVIASNLYRDRSKLFARNGGTYPFTLIPGAGPKTSLHYHIFSSGLSGDAMRLDREASLCTSDVSSARPTALRISMVRVRVGKARSAPARAQRQWQDIFLTQVLVGWPTIVYDMPTAPTFPTPRIMDGLLMGLYDPYIEIGDLAVLFTKRLPASASCLEAADNPVGVIAT